MIQSYLFPLSKNESKCIASIGWEFIKNQKERKGYRMQMGEKNPEQ